MRTARVRIHEDERISSFVEVARWQGPWRLCEYAHVGHALPPPPAAYLVEDSEGRRSAACGFHLDEAIRKGLPEVTG